MVAGTDERTLVTTAGPEIDGERCVHARFATASCRACVDSCARRALVLDAASLDIDTAICDGCGVCRAACPEAAIEVDGVAGAALTDTAARLAVVACERSGARAGKGVVACIHALGERDLARLATVGIERLVVASGACDACERYPKAALHLDLKAAAHRHNIVADAARLELERVGCEVFERIRTRVLRSGDDLDQRRRRFFGLGVGRTQPAAKRERGPYETSDARFRHVPEIDAQACSGCDACIRVCRHGALRLVNDGPTGLAYAISPEHCTGCRLCVDVCATHAVNVAELEPCRKRSLSLRSSTCKHCGTPFHEPDANAVSGDGSGAATSGICGVCRATRRTRLLFQVVEG